MVRMERNAGEVDDFIRFWSALPGVDQVRIKEDETNLMRPDAGHAAEEWKHPCHYLWRGPMYVKQNGDVYPCCQSYMLDGEPRGQHRRAAARRDLELRDEMQRMRRLHVSGPRRRDRHLLALLHDDSASGAGGRQPAAPRQDGAPAAAVVERLTYLSRLPKALLTPPKPAEPKPELVQIGRAGSRDTPR